MSTTSAVLSIVGMVNKVAILCSHEATTKNTPPNFREMFVLSRCVVGKFSAAFTESGKLHSADESSFFGKFPQVFSEAGSGSV